jgi:hypothetical protein
VDDAAEDVATSNCAASASGDRVGDRVGELQAAMRPRLVVVANALVEHSGSVANAAMELTLQHADLVAEHHQLDVLVQSCPSARSQQTEDPASDEAAQAESHN